jgi:hypothetical protein
VDKLQRATQNSHAAEYRVYAFAETCGLAALVSPNLLWPLSAQAERKRESRMSWKVEVITDDSGAWEGDALRFPTEQEALAYARDLEFRCSAVRDKRIVRSDEPPSHRWGTRAARAISDAKSVS